MTVPFVAGYPDYSTATGSKRIPWLFAQKVLRKFYPKTFLSTISNNDFNAQIKNMGDKVVIRTRPDVTVKSYTKGGTMVLDYLDSPSIEFNLDRAAYFYFGLDKIDIKQMDIKLLDEGAIDAAEQMKIYIEKQFLPAVVSDADANNVGLTAGASSHLYNMGASGSPLPISKVNITDYIVAANSVGAEANWAEDEEWWMILPIPFYNMLLRSELKGVNLTGDSITPLRKGDVGNPLGNFTIYKSNLYTSVTDGSDQCYNILFGHKSAICFATQLTEMDYFEKLENTAGAAMRGLNVYDFKTVKKESLGVLYAKPVLGY